MTSVHEIIQNLRVQLRFCNLAIPRDRELAGRIQAEIDELINSHAEFRSMPHIKPVSDGQDVVRRQALLNTILS